MYFVVEIKVVIVIGNVRNALVPLRVVNAKKKNSSIKVGKAQPAREGRMMMLN